MRTAQPQAAQELAHEHGAIELCLTPQGIDLLDGQPDRVDTFLDMARQLTAEVAPPAGTFEWIDRGKVGHVFGMPESDELCVKVVSPRTFTGNKSDPTSTAGIPSLVVESKIMHRVGKLLDRRPETGVKAPAQYGVAKFAGGSALLQQRVPESYASIHKLSLNDTSSEGRQFWRQQSEIAFKRVWGAVGHSLLKIAANDMRGTRKAVNQGNFLISPVDLAESGDIYVVDLVGNTFAKRNVARAIATLL